MYAGGTMLQRFYVLITAATAFLTVTAAPIAHAAPLIDPNATLQQNLQNFYPVAVRIIVFLAFLAVIYAGYVYITSFGKPERITEAKNWLIAAITGLALILLVPVVLDVLDSIKAQLPTPSPSTAAPATSTTPLQSGSDSTAGAGSAASDSPSSSTVSPDANSTSGAAAAGFDASKSIEGAGGISGQPPK